MEIKFAKWGNSIAMRVPRKVAEALGIVPGSVADLALERDKIIIVPRLNAYRVEELVAGITPENLHQEMGTGSSIGAEIID